ncbi:outer membrane beta-barrel protein [Helicobacter pametensis]|uniref:outer membrane beta-barrel protein n=1 Tax=Helicobacter pametensis TaxID=95149 RepID=UPI00048A04ED|nr:outer membrane beta-barrel protein [Helicobacter pametensis]
MQIIFICLLIFSCIWGINYNVLPSESRSGAQMSNRNTGKIAPQVIPPQRSSTPSRSQSLGVKIQPNQNNNSQSFKQNLNVQVQNARPPQYQPKQALPNVNVIPPYNPVQTQQKNPNLKVKVYPPEVSNDRDTQNLIQPSVSPSRPITQDMMFQKMPPYKMKLPPRKPRPKPIQAPPPAVVQMVDEYEGEDIEPLFIRNRNGVMIGAGIGGSIDRMWVGGNGGNQRFYDSAFSYYFRLGYQHYFTDYLGVRAYAHLGDWSNHFSETFFDDTRNVVVDAKLSFNYSFYAEVLYDFVVLQNHSFGVFGGFGVGVSYGEFSNDGTDTLSEYYAMPALSLGFAYTLYENNRFELESKIPLHSEILQKEWRTELSTWMIGVSYTYIF